MNALENQLLESAADSFSQIANEFISEKVSIIKKRFEGIMDFWYRGVILRNINYSDTVTIKCKISPYTQLFPGNPFNNAVRWNKLYSNNINDTTQLSSTQTIAFYIGSDMALRLKPFADNVVVGLYEKYGYIGNGLLGTISKTELLKIMPYFFDVDFCGKYVELTGIIGKCPIEHSIKIKEIAEKANLKINFNQFSSLPYLKITKVQFPKFYQRNRSTALLGSPWIALNDETNPYQVRYGYFSNESEITPSINALLSYSNITCFFDELISPSEDLNFSSQYMF